MRIRLRQLTAALFVRYFRACLALGFKEHVFSLSSKWGGAKKVLLGKDDAAWFIQDTLIEKHGFYRCPSCYWATRKPDEHINEHGSYCWEEENRHFGIIVEDELDQKIDQLADDIAREHELRFGPIASTFN